MGHAYEHTISDAFIRHQRMLGRETLWLPGTDHAGIATQALMERMLAAEGTTRQDLGRDGFLARTRSWRASTGEAITTQMRRLGASPDWSRATYTLDPGPGDHVSLRSRGTDHRSGTGTGSGGAAMMAGWNRASGNGHRFNPQRCQQSSEESTVRGGSPAVGPSTCTWAGRPAPVPTSTC